MFFRLIKKPIFWILFVIIIIPAVYVFCGLYYDIKAQVNRKTIEKIMEKDEQIKITSYDFIEQFIINSENASNYYKHKIIQITGIIEYIGLPKDNPPLKDNSYITFLNSENTDSVAIICYFTNNKTVPALKNNKEGEITTIIGKYRSHNLEGEYKYIEIGDCEIVNK
jgi:heme/copper-type cytochrome/quinol oxidase subunit 2